MSRVFVADEVRLGRKVVVKVLSPDLAAGVSAERFEREIRVAASLQHANIVPVLTAGDADGVAYYTMPFVKGESLRSRLARDGALSIDETVAILRDVAKALAYAHGEGIVHRDIKPDNVLLSGGTAVVTDFGIAKALAAARQSHDDATITQLGTSIGTPAYMSPEQAGGDPHVDHRADLYAFGCMAYELLTGQPPFAGRTAQRILAAHMTETPTALVEVRPDVPREIAELIARCLAKEPTQRPGSAAEVLRTLDGVTATGPSVLVEPRGMLRRALVVYAAAYIVVAGLARTAIFAIGLPDWVFPGALVVMALGLPVVLFTGYAKSVASRLATATPTITPGGSAVMPTHGTMASIAVKANPHMSWRRAMLGGAFALGGFAALVAVFMILRGLGVGPFGSLLVSGKVSGQLVVSDFAVVRADSTLGSVLSQAVRANLDQSSVIRLLPAASVTAALERMRRPASSRLDLALARELATREGIRVIVDGEVDGIGRGLLLTLRLVSADSGRVLASYREVADEPEQLIDAVDRLTRKLRGRIGESFREVNASLPLAQVTTPSLDALRKYTAASQATAMGRWPDAVRLSREAIAIDTGFALAYRHLSESLTNGGWQQSDADSAIAKAYARRDRLSERERLIVTGDYYWPGPGRDRGRAAEAYARLLELGDYSNTNSYGQVLSSRRDFAKAESLGLVRIRVDPGYALTYGNLVSWQVQAGRLAAAESTSRLAAERFPNRSGAWVATAMLFLARGEFDSADAVIDSARRTDRSAYRDRADNALSSSSLVRGRLRDAARWQANVAQTALAKGVVLRPIFDSLAVIRREAWLLGPSPTLARRIEESMQRYFDAMPIADRPYDRVALTYAAVGRPDRARAMIARYEAEVRDTTRKRAEAHLFHAVQGEIALAERRAGDAIVEFRRADSLPDGPASWCLGCVLSSLARAFDAANMSDSTIATIERYFASPELTRGGITILNLRVASSSPYLQHDPVLYAPLAKRLGELYEARGDRAKAAAYYLKFVTLWKNADPELQPRVAEVRQRLARLRDVEPR